MTSALRRARRPFVRTIALRSALSASTLALAVSASCTHDASDTTTTSSYQNPPCPTVCPATLADLLGESTCSYQSSYLFCPGCQYDSAGCGEQVFASCENSHWVVTDPCGSGGAAGAGGAGAAGGSGGSGGAGG